MKDEAYDEPGMLPREGKKSGKIRMQGDNTLAKGAAADWARSRASQFSLPARRGIPPIRAFCRESFWGLTSAGAGRNISECRSGQFPQPGCSCWGLRYS